MRGESCYYSGYGADGYGLYELSGWRDSAVPVGDDLGETELMRMRNACIASSAAATAHGAEDEVVGGGESSEEDGTSEVAGHGGEAGLPGAGNFGIDYSRLFLFPTILIYEEMPRIGLYVDTRDILDRQSVTAGATINADKEFDIQLSFEVRQFKPTFSFDFYRSD